MKPTPLSPLPDPRATEATVQLPEAPPPVFPLAEALASIRADSRQQAAEYLRETVVPHGGE